MVNSSVKTEPSSSSSSSLPLSGDPAELNKAQRMSNHMKTKSIIVTPAECLQAMRLNNGNTGETINYLTHLRQNSTSSSSASASNPNGIKQQASNGKGPNTSTPAPRKRDSRDDDDERDAYGDDSDQEGAQDEEEKQERAAIKWFNECDESALIDTTGELEALERA